MSFISETMHGFKPSCISPNSQFMIFVEAAAYCGAAVEIVWPKLVALVIIGVVTLPI